jgi:hypothetical protein
MVNVKPKKVTEYQEMGKNSLWDENVKANFM